MRDLIERPADLAAHLKVDVPALEAVTAQYPMRINRYFLEQAIKSGSGLLRQVVPDPRELNDPVGLVDPLAEERDSPAPCITHRYPDRVLFLVSHACAVNCRFCTRKRKIGHWPVITDAEIEAGVAYIRSHREISDVLISGGDPLMLSDERIDWILGQVRSIPHVETLRIGTRMPSALPYRITPALIDRLKLHAPLFINTHFNHPAELTKSACKALGLLADAGIPLGCQTVLLRGINDDAETLKRLFRLLIRNRVRPYYLLQGDLTRGTNHFRTRVEAGLEIMRKLRGPLTGLAVPQYIMDLPEGGGKVPLVPEYIVGETDNVLAVRNYEGRLCHYPQVE